MNARLKVNPRFAEGAYGARQQAVMSEADYRAAERAILSWPEYAATPLVDRPDLARSFRVGSVGIKYEGARFAVQSFKALGPPYAVQCLAGEAKPPLVFASATSGNHGRAVAWAAQRLGAGCRIYMNENVSAGRARAIESFGATVIRVPGTYDDALARCHGDAETNGSYVISDVAQAAYPKVPAHTMHGYAMLGQELVDAADDATHVFVGAGIGALAGAVTGRLWQSLGARRPKVVVVEPLTADAVYQSAARGKLSRTDGSLATVMDGLSVGTASHLAWEILDEGAFGFLAIPDPPAVTAMKMAHDGPDSLVIGETGIAGLAGALVATNDETMRRELGLDGKSKVVAIACEGPTDLDVFHRLLSGRSAA
ncbi:MAG: pyridoxal-phosphate dependent enzyme [Alphaproteobacteria bacterium]|nr:pyridoxal-phosphate dependent enzyme [Alphaproteobacteria bacterium]